MPLVDFLSVPFLIVAGLGIVLGANVRSLAEETSAAAGRVAGRVPWLHADEWDRTPNAIRWYGWGTSCAALYVAGVLLGLRGLAGLGLLGAVGCFVASALPPKRPGRPLRGWSDRLRVWQLAGWLTVFLVGFAGVALATVAGVR